MVEFEEDLVDFVSYYFLKEEHVHVPGQDFSWGGRGGGGGVCTSRTGTN